jgi:hypothetical protein
MEFCRIDPWRCMDASIWLQTSKIWICWILLKEFRNWPSRSNEPMNVVWPLGDKLKAQRLSCLPLGVKFVP